MKTMTKEEVMQFLQVKSRDTLYRYERDSGFPHPIKTHPTLYLTSAVEEWVIRRSEPKAA